MSYSQQYEGYTYYRNLLTGINKDAYDVFYYHISQMDSSFSLQAEDDDAFMLIIDYVMKDHPELFWYDAMDVSYSIHEQQGSNVYDIHTKLKKKQTEIEQEKQQVNEKAAVLLTEMKKLPSDYEKAKYAYDYIIDHTNYNEDSKENQNILSVFLYEDSVCAGYAKTFQYLMNACGIPCVYMTGGTKYSSDNHAWNMVLLDGSYYYMDTTNGDYSNETIDQRIRYAYFAMDTAQMLQLYTPDDPYEITKATIDNYFVKENLYLDTTSMDKLSFLIQQSVQDEDQKGFLFQCNTKETCTTISQSLEHQDTIFRLLDKAGYHAEQYKSIIIPETNVWLYSYK